MLTVLSFDEVSNSLVSLLVAVSCYLMMWSAENLTNEYVILNPTLCKETTTKTLVGDNGVLGQPRKSKIN